MKKIIIIGAGAAGLFCALNLRDTDTEITLLEADKKAARKLLATGNGRCNLSHTGANADCYDGDKTLINALFSDYDEKADTEYLKSLFIPVSVIQREDGGYIYPASFTAQSVRDTLLDLCTAAGIKILTETAFESLEKSGGGYVINKKFYADFVIFACGSRSVSGFYDPSPVLSVLSAHGVKCGKIFPALCPLIPGKSYPRSLKGVRQNCNLRLFADGKETAKEYGEVQFNEKNIGGIPVFQLSHKAAKALGRGQKVRLEIDRIPAFSQDEISAFAYSAARALPQELTENLLSPLAPKKLFFEDMKKLNIPVDARVCDVPGKVLDRFISGAKFMSFDITAVSGFDSAQTVCGGISSSELSENLELKKLKNCYVTGELLDVNGRCGGYNLLACRLSAAAAAKHIKGKLC